VLINAARSDASPLVRSAAAGSLKESPMGDTATVLFGALSDSSALVRIRAVSMIAMLSSQAIVPEFRQKFEKSFVEFTTMLSARPDDPQTYFNLGNLYLERRDITRALAMYDQLLKLDPKNYQAVLNSGMAKYYAADLSGAEQTIRRAITLQPRTSQAHVILGMLLVEQKKTQEAENAFRTAIKYNPADATAYYNLGVLNAEDKLKNALALCRKAYALEPDTPKYGYTYAYYLNRAGKPDDAIAVLKKMVDKNLPHPESYALLANLFMKQKKTKEAKMVYRKALGNKAIPQDVRTGFMDQLQKLE
jgi:Flp pilus assembly protein TadD